VVDLGDRGQLARRRQLVARLEAAGVDRVDEEVHEPASHSAVLGAVELGEGRQIKFV